VKMSGASLAHSFSQKPCCVLEQSLTAFSSAICFIFDLYLCV
jgi:hypothetical protein